MEKPPESEKAASDPGPVKTKRPVRKTKTAQQKQTDSIDGSQAVAQGKVEISDSNFVGGGNVINNTVIGNVYETHNPLARAAGIDASFWDATPDWAKVFGQGKRFVFLKATEADSYSDPTFVRNWSDTKSAGLLRGAYHFFRSNVDPQKQAEQFIRVLNSAGDPGELPPVLDLESHDNQENELILSNAKTWLDLVEVAFGRKPMIYSTPSFLRDHFYTPDGGPPSWTKDYPLWIAEYPVQLASDLNPLNAGDINPELPPGWTQWMFWQYSDRGRVEGVNSSVDLNVFNGSLEDLHHFAGTPLVRITDKVRLNFALNDRPEGPDRLSYEKYADAFAQVLSGQYTQTPLTVGIYATWGMGKSFLLGKIKEKLKLLEKQREELYFAFIDFNAWVYSGSENLWAGLVTSLYNGIEEHYEARGGRLVQSYRRKEALKQIRQTFTKSLGLVVLFGIPALLISLFLNYQTIQENWKNLLQTLLLIITGSPLLAKLPDLLKEAKSLLDSLVLLRSQELANLSSRKDFRDKIGFMADIQSELRHISGLIQQIDAKEKRKTRFVIFVDDLDRCPPEKAVEVLEAIMLLLSDQNKDPFIIFLAMDARVLVKAIEMRYGKVLTESGISGYEFLDKIVQIPFRIPPANDDAIKGYVKSLLYQSAEAADKAAQPTVEPSKEKAGTLQSEPSLGSDNGTESTQAGATANQTATPTEVQKEPEQKIEKISEEEPFNEDEKQAFESFSNFISRNPRRVKRIVNIYRLARILLASDISVQAAIKWVILTEQWPFRIAWIMQKIDDDLQLGKPISKNSALANVYETVKRHVKEEKSHQLALLDEDGEEFDAFIMQDPPLTVEEIYQLWTVTFNLNPAMQSEVLKSAMLSNSREPAGQVTPG